jgi:ubiquinone/menaquinone biosynthesis C-methylase UbiE
MNGTGGSGNQAAVRQDTAVGGATKAGSPDRILALVHGYAVSQILAAAARYRFFTVIAGGQTTAEAVAAAAGTDPRGTRMVLDSLVVIELLTKRDGRYALGPEAQAFLVEGRPGSLTRTVAELPGLHWDQWSRLPDLLASGQQPHGMTDLDQATTFFPRLIRAIMPLGLGAADRTAEHFGIGASRTGVRVLDIGAGSAAWSIPFARRDPSSAVTAFDLPDVLAETRQIVAEFGVAGQYTFEPGDLMKADFRSARYDFAILGNICHGLLPEANRDLFGRIRPALAPGGRLLIVDMLPNEARTGPPTPVLFAVTMFVMGGADTYTLSQYTAWLTAAGYSSVETFDTGRTHSPVIVASV